MFISKPLPTFKCKLFVARLTHVFRLQKILYFSFSAISMIHFFFFKLHFLSVIHNWFSFDMFIKCFIYYPIMLALDYNESNEGWLSKNSAFLHAILWFLLHRLIKLNHISVTFAFIKNISHLHVDSSASYVRCVFI